MLIARNSFFKYLFLFLIGGFAYGAIENLSRGYSHISMFIAGGICFILIGILNDRRKKLSLIGRMAISAVIITIVEFIVGMIVNIWLKLDVWDYSHMPFNLMGQICPLYSIFWFFISFAAIMMDAYIRRRLLKEEGSRLQLP
ncbi:MAG: hypothetical protein GX757_11970 [Clostridiales bacterium]|nr:hypothetical protein [Clostridiales bacterium]